MPNSTTPPVPQIEDMIAGYVARLKAEGYFDKRAVRMDTRDGPIYLVSDPNGVLPRKEAGPTIMGIPTVFLTDDRK